MLSYNVLYTRDSSKKRKRWCDGEFLVNTGHKDIKCVSELKQKCDVTSLYARIVDKSSGTNNCVYSDTMPKVSIFSLLIDGDEVKCGSVLVQCHELEPCIPNADPNSFITSGNSDHILSKSLRNGSGNVVPSRIQMGDCGMLNRTLPYRSPGTAYKPFKVPSYFDRASSHVGSSMQLKSGIVPKQESLETGNVEMTAEVTIRSSNSSHLNKTHIPVPGSVCQSPISVPIAASNTVYLLDLPKTYANNRSVVLPLYFKNETQYARIFVESLCEEFRVSVADLMAQLEIKMLKFLQDSNATGSTIPWTSSSNSSMSSTKPVLVHHLKHSGFCGSKSGSNKQVNQLRVCGEMQRIGVPMFAEADIIVSGGNNSGHGSNMWNDSKLRNQDRYPSNKRRKIEEDSDEDEDGIEEYKMYLKVPEAMVGSSNGCSASSGSNKPRFEFGKDDVWVLWRGTDFDMIGPDTDNTSGKTIISDNYVKLKEDYLNAMTHGYNFPWFKGRVMKRVWLVRSLWHSFSKDAAMTEIDNLNGSHTTLSRNGTNPDATAVDPMTSTFPPHILSEIMRDMRQLSLNQPKSTLNCFSPGNTIKHYKRMQQKGLFKFYALRLSNEMCSLMPIDIMGCPQTRLLGRGNRHCFNVNEGKTLWQEAYYNSVVCQRILIQENANNSSGLSCPPHLKQNSRQFPQLAHALVDNAYHLVRLEFGLNIDQESVLRQVASWFLADGEKIESIETELGAGTGSDTNSDVILVHGVFGSGKSHLIAAICVLLSTLFHVYNSRKGETDHGDNTKYRRIGLKCMISSNTNVAVDRILTQLAFPRKLNEESDLEWPEMVRIGNVFKVNRALRKHLMLQYDNKQSAHNELLKVLRMEQGQALYGTEDRELEELKQLVTATGKETSTQYSDRQKRMLDAAEVVGITCASAGLYIQQQFQAQRLSGTNSVQTNGNGCFLPCQVLILDEASQMLEPVSLLPIITAIPMKMIVVGDPLQLPPTLASQAPSARNTDISDTCTCIPNDLSRTLFDRLSHYDRSTSSAHTTLPANSNVGGFNGRGFSRIMLRTQYRCHPDIANICNELFYENQLINGVNELSRKSVLGPVDSDSSSRMKITIPPVCCFHNSHPEMRRGDSYINQGEAEVVLTLIRDIFALVQKSTSTLNDGEPATKVPTIGVICMYKAQAHHVNKLLMEHLSVGNTKDIDCKGFNPMQHVQTSTVDAFQGCEKDIIFICTSRNADTSFISNPNRLNVAISRAKSHLFVIGNLGVLGNNSLWKRVIASSTLAKSNRLVSAVESV